MKTRFDTDDYKMAHGKAPKGEGKWFFEAVGVDENGSTTDLGNHSTFGSFAAAKREAKTWFNDMASSIGRVKEVIVFVGS